MAQAARKTGGRKAKPEAGKTISSKAPVGTLILQQQNLLSEMDKHEDPLDHVADMAMAFILNKVPDESVDKRISALIAQSHMTGDGSRVAEREGDQAKAAAEAARARVKIAAQGERQPGKIRQPDLWELDPEGTLYVREAERREAALRSDEVVIEETVLRRVVGSLIREEMKGEFGKTLGDGIRRMIRRELRVQRELDRIEAEESKGRKAG